LSAVAANSLITGLVKSYFPVHVIKEFVVNDGKDRAHAEFQRSLRVGKALVIWVSSLICFSNWTEDSKVFDFNCLFLMLNHIAEAFCNGAPDHVEETEGLALVDFERVCASDLFTGLWRCWVSDELQVELGEIVVEEAWVVHTLLKEGEFGDRRHSLRWSANTIIPTEEEKGIRNQGSGSRDTLKRR